MLQLRQFGERLDSWIADARMVEKKTAQIRQLPAGRLLTKSAGSRLSGDVLWVAVKLRDEPVRHAKCAVVLGQLSRRAREGRPTVARSQSSTLQIVNGPESLHDFQ